MGDACGTYGREETCVQGFSGGGNVTESNKLAGLGVDGRIILK